MVLCADAVLDGESLIGDPTEGALIVLGAKGGLDIDATRRAYPRVAEVPFDSEYKFMATFHEMTGADGRPVVRCYVKGAPDVLIAKGTTYRTPEGEPSKSRMRIAQPPQMATTAGRRRSASHGRRAARPRPATFDPAGDLIGLGERAHAPGDGRDRRSS